MGCRDGGGSIKKKRKKKELYESRKQSAKERDKELEDRVKIGHDESNNRQEMVG